MNSGRLSCCELSGESDSLITVDCSALVSDLRSRLGSGEDFDSIIADLEYGVEQELEEFAKMLLVLLTETVGENTTGKNFRLIPHCGTKL